jgi:glycosyl transferase family 9 (putative heptosyltransferase)
MKSILVIRPGAIGDALLSFPILNALREPYDGTRITLVSNAQVLPLALAFGVAEQTFDFQDIQWSELFSSNGIRTSSMRDLLAQTDPAICWMRDPESIVEHNLKTSGIEHVIIAPGRPSAGEHLHIVDYLARTLGLPNRETQFFAPIMRRPNESSSASVGARVDKGWLGGPLWSPVGEEYSRLATIKTPEIATKRFVAVHPGSGAAEKCWPISRFTEVIKRLWKQNQPVLLLSGPADTKRVEDLLKYLSRPPAPEMFKTLTDAPLLEVAQHLQQCMCYLGNDSGITHLAAMLGVPTVAIFGPTDPKIWRPIGPFVKVLHGHTLEDVSVDEVMGAIL